MYPSQNIQAHFVYYSLEVSKQPPPPPQTNKIKITSFTIQLTCVPPQYKQQKAFGDFFSSEFLRASKAAFVLGENDFRKSFSPFSASLVAMENTIFRKLHSC